MYIYSDCTTFNRHTIPAVLIARIGRYYIVVAIAVSWLAELHDCGNPIIIIIMEGICLIVFKLLS